MIDCGLIIDGKFMYTSLSALYFVIIVLLYYILTDFKKKGIMQNRVTN